MKKTILILVLIIVIALAGGVYYLLTSLDAIVEAAIEKYGSEATQTAVRVDGVTIKLREGDGEIRGLTIANPKGYEQPIAFGLAKTGLGIELKSLKEEPYVINHITVSGPRVYAEVNADNQLNLNQLRKNLAAGAGTDKAKDKPSGGKAVEPKLIIKRLTFEEGIIAANVVPLNTRYDMALPNINMTDLGGSKGATPKQLAKQILDRLIDAAKAEIKKKGIDAELDKLKGKAREKVEEEKARLKEKADSKVEEEKQKAEDKLKELLK